MSEQVVLVDKKDNIIDVEEKLKAHQMGVLHRAFSIFILRRNPELELLIQKRALTKYHSGGLWTNSCCGHPRPSETLIEAATRRLKEEIGLSLSLPLKEIGVFTYKADVGNNLTEHEIDHIFIGYWEGEPIIPNPEEVETLQWRNLDQTLAEMNQYPSLFTVWVKEGLEMVINFAKK
jgi:isopentenyl-diphosphate Delta-isomerase